MKLNKPKSIKIRTLYGQAYDLLKAIAKNRDYEMVYDDSVYAKELLKHIDGFEGELNDLRSENSRLKDNWNELEKWLKENKWQSSYTTFEDILDKTQEIKERKQ